MRRNLSYYCLFAPRTYIFVLRAHPVRGESHNQRNTTGEVATVPGMNLQGPDFSDSKDPVFIDSRDPMMIFSDSRDPNRVPETP